MQHLLDLAIDIVPGPFSLAPLVLPLVLLPAEGVGNVCSLTYAAVASIKGARYAFSEASSSGACLHGPRIRTFVHREREETVSDHHLHQR